MCMGMKWPKWWLVEMRSYHLYGWSLWRTCTVQHKAPLTCTLCSRGKVHVVAATTTVCDQPMAQVRRYRTRTHAHTQTQSKIAHNTNGARRRARRYTQRCSSARSVWCILVGLSMRRRLCQLLRIGEMYLEHWEASSNVFCGLVCASTTPHNCWIYKTRGFTHKIGDTFSP